MEAEQHLEPEDCGLSKEQTEALRLLNLAGVRIIRRDYDLQIGVWEDLDGLRSGQALRTVGLDVHPIVHLESRGIDFRYKVRRTPDRAHGRVVHGVVEARRSRRSRRWWPPTREHEPVQLQLQ